MAVLLIVIGLVVAVGVIFILNARGQTTRVAMRSVDELDERSVREPLPIAAIDPPGGADNGHIGWAKQFEPRSGELSDEARLQLINDLGLLRAPWCAPLLAQACSEETDPSHRIAAQTALARCRDQNLL